MESDFGQLFISAPCLETLSCCCKQDLYAVAAHYNIVVSQALAKAEVYKCVLNTLLEKGVLVEAQMAKSTVDTSVAPVTPVRVEQVEDYCTRVKATLPRFNPGFSSSGSRDDARAKVRIARLQLEAQEKCVGKPNKVIPPAPLHPIPAIGEPFERVLVHCVGPLPKTKAGNQYLLTIMCAATQFPEAMPLRGITAKAVTSALVKFFYYVRPS